MARKEFSVGMSNYIHTIYLVAALRGLLCSPSSWGREGFSGSERTAKKGVEAQGHCVLFYPKFHCELNFIESYWCQAKWFERENCGYNFEAPFQGLNLPALLADNGKDSQPFGLPGK